MAIHPKGIIYYFYPHAFFLSPTEKTHHPYYETAFIKLQVIFFFSLFANRGGEPGSSGLNEISYTSCMRKVLGHVRWRNSPE